MEIINKSERKIPIINQIRAIKDQIREMMSPQGSQTEKEYVIRLYANLIFFKMKTFLIFQSFLILYELQSNSLNREEEIQSRMESSGSDPLLKGRGLAENGTPAKILRYAS